MRRYGTEAVSTPTRVIGMSAPTRHPRTNRHKTGEAKAPEGTSTSTPDLLLSVRRLHPVLPEGSALKGE